jgi:hypothetical protein
VEKYFINNEKPLGHENARQKCYLQKMKKHFGKIAK